MRLPSFMRAGWWWFFYVLVLGGAVGLLVSLAVIDADRPVWMSLGVVSEVGAAGLMVMGVRVRGPSRT